MAVRFQDIHPRFLPKGGIWSAPVRWFLKLSKGLTRGRG
jgi:hypothetical protein